MDVLVRLVRRVSIGNAIPLLVHLAFRQDLEIVSLAANLATEDLSAHRLFVLV